MSKNKCLLSLPSSSDKDGAEVVPDQCWGLSSVNAVPETLLPVVLDNGSSLGMVGGQTLAQSLGVVVGALNKRLASDIVDTSLLGWATE